MIGLGSTEVERGLVRARLGVDNHLLAPNGYLHAASVILLADTGAGYATVAHLPEGAKNFTTVELKTTFLGSAKEGTLRAACVAEHIGRTTQIWSSSVFGPNGPTLAIFR